MSRLRAPGGRCAASSCTGGPKRRFRRSASRPQGSRPGAAGTRFSSPRIMAQLTSVTPRATTSRPAEPRDAQAIATMSRDFSESGLGWKYDAARVMRAMRDRETLAVVACEGAKGSGRAAVAGFAIMEFGDERAHLVLLA